MAMTSIALGTKRLPSGQKSMYTCSFFHVRGKFIFEMLAVTLSVPVFHKVLQGAPPRGRQLYFTFQVLQTLDLKRQKHPFLP